ncbi:Type IV fimbrial biogenesis protein PilY1, partial [hydrothermal vent metagenome]
SDRWSGDLIAYNIDIVNNTLGSIAWRASTDIDSRSANSRNIITSNGSSGLAFEWSTLTTAQKNDLRTNSSGSLDNEATGMARLDYIRGERGCESNNTTGTCSYTDSGGGTFTNKSFRPRNSALGDIIHSSPFYVGPPSTRYPDDIETTPYSTFAQAQVSRAGVSYVGSNDGMMHAFDEVGDELFAFVPNLLYSTASGAGMHDLSAPGYLHDYYVDLSVSVADAFINLGAGNSWKSILVGGLRGGGKGLFAMDVTNPSSLASTSGAAGNVLWEFTHSDLGFTYSDIRIARLNNGKWAAIFGNGYNSDPTGDGTSKVFIVYLDGSNLANPILLETGQGNITNNSCNDPASDCNGMSTPAIADLNGDGSIDRIYAGDLHGKLWAFDVSSSNPANWNSAYGTSPAFSPLFSACNGGCTPANRQPITEKPAISRHPTRRDLITEPNLMVFFGTGQYLTINDTGTTDTQAFYGVWDNGSGDADRSSLLSQIISETTTSGSIAVRTVSDNAIDYNSQRGWMFDLPTSGERSVTSPLAFGSLVFFNTVIPSTTTCAAGGYGWLMAVDLFNGGEPDFQPIDVNGDGVFSLADQAGNSNTVGTQTTGIPTESRFIADRRVTATSDGTVLFEKIRPTNPKAPERMSWTNVER